MCIAVRLAICHNSLQCDDLVRRLVVATPTTAQPQPNSFETWLDQVLKEVIGDGNTAHLHGAGKPLDLSALDDPNTPNEWRLAYKVMRDNDAAPRWIVMGQELRQLREQIRRVLAHFARDYQARLREAQLRGSFTLERDARRAGALLRNALAA